MLPTVQTVGDSAQGAQNPSPRQTLVSGKYGSRCSCLINPVLYLLKFKSALLQHTKPTNHFWRNVFDCVFPPSSDFRGCILLGVGLPLHFVSWCLFNIFGSVPGKSWYIRIKTSQNQRECFYSPCAACVAVIVGSMLDGFFCLLLPLTCTPAPVSCVHQCTQRQCVAQVAF